MKVFFNRQFFLKIINRTVYNNKINDEKKKELEECLRIM